MKPGRIVMLVLGTLAALMGLGLLITAGAVGWVNFQQRDNGYLTTPTERYDVATRAITSPGLNVLVDEKLPDVLPVDSAGRLLLRGTGAAGQQIFIGIGPQEDVARYLDNVRHSEITELNSYPFRVQYREVPGDAVPVAPGTQPFWSTSAQGTGTQQIEWDLRSGRWAVVVMNADGAAPVSVDLQAGVRSDLLWPVFIGLLIGGIALLVVGVPLIVAGAAGLGRHGPPPHYPEAARVAPGAVPVGPDAHGPNAEAPYATAAAPIPPGGGGRPLPTDPQPSETSRYPVRLNGYLDPGLSRGMWLIKWFLAIPHYIVLFFLWFAFFVTTIVAGFAILFTGHYPRSLFNFNVGVLRWNWRVAFYAYAAIGTDRYPPFTLARTDYPADFDVEYPEHLSRGLVLIKWWLLALPQLLIVSAFSGAASTWGTRRTWVDGRWVDGNWVDGTWVGYQGGGGISLIGLLVIVAGFSLLFTGRFGRRLFDLLIGLNRWTHRVIAYVALMRDEYPPFRLDMGPSDPADAPPVGYPPPVPARPETQTPEGEP
ncbi:DUF4389 domain-containing protein [Arthrobacter sp. 24S4-2]|uniref:DUF4389 domain-containing protein n=1 Tax=Arthrobacter sp. 24S4-2 TaxID=2575374 RepID=UPI0010C772E6|nr:DUF4389 domain-containing protein [Arthrobacter sp. 24S4-2]QCP00328.1 DUF4389 domain-containing protein [Arthrobacter sp. 24S4-2]